MPDTATAARKAVAENIRRERKQLQQQLRDAQKTEKEVAKRQKAASDRYWTLAKRNGMDNDPDEKEREAARAHDIATNAYLGVTRKIELLQSKLAALDDTGEVERRVQDEARKIEGLARLREINATRAKPTAGDKPTNGGQVTAGTATPRRTRTTEIPEAVGKKVKAMLEDGTSVKDAIAKLKSDKVKSPFGDSWTPRAVRTTYKKFTGKSNIPAKAKKAGRTTLAERPPASTRKVQTAGRKNGAVAAAAEAKPLSKAAQARGTSRGGTGSRKKKTAAARRR